MFVSADKMPALLDETEAILGDPRLGDPLFGPNQAQGLARPRGGALILARVAGFF